MTAVTGKIAPTPRSLDLQSWFAILSTWLRSSNLASMAADSELTSTLAEFLGALRAAAAAATATDEDVCQALQALVYCLSESHQPAVLRSCYATVSELLQHPAVGRLIESEAHGHTIHEFVKAASTHIQALIDGRDSNPHLADITVILHVLSQALCAPRLFDNLDFAETNLAQSTTSLMGWRIKWAEHLELAALLLKLLLTIAERKPICLFGWSRYSEEFVGSLIAFFEALAATELGRRCLELFTSAVRFSPRWNGEVLMYACGKLTDLTQRHLAALYFELVDTILAVSPAADAPPLQVEAIEYVLSECRQFVEQSDSERIAEDHRISLVRGMARALVWLLSALGGNKEKLLECADSTGVCLLQRLCHAYSQLAAAEMETAASSEMLHEVNALLKLAAAWKGDEGMSEVLPRSNFVRACSEMLQPALSPVAQQALAQLLVHESEPACVVFVEEPREPQFELLCLLFHLQAGSTGASPTLRKQLNSMLQAVRATTHGMRGADAALHQCLTACMSSINECVLTGDVARLTTSVLLLTIAHPTGHDDFLIRTLSRLGPTLASNSVGGCARTAGADQQADRLRLLDAALYTLRMTIPSSFEVLYAASVEQAGSTRLQGALGVLSGALTHEFTTAARPDHAFTILAAVLIAAEHVDFEKITKDLLRVGVFRSCASEALRAPALAAARQMSAAAVAAWMERLVTTTQYSAACSLASSDKELTLECWTQLLVAGAVASLDRSDVQHAHCARLLADALLLDELPSSLLGHLLSAVKPELGPEAELARSTLFLHACFLQVQCDSSAAIDTIQLLRRCEATSSANAATSRVVCNLQFGSWLLDVATASASGGNGFHRNLVALMTQHCLGSESSQAELACIAQVWDALDQLNNDARTGAVRLKELVWEMQGFLLAGVQPQNCVEPAVRCLEMLTLAIVSLRAAAVAKLSPSLLVWVCAVCAEVFESCPVGIAGDNLDLFREAVLLSLAVCLEVAELPTAISELLLADRRDWLVQVLQQQAPGPKDAPSIVRRVAAAFAKSAKPERRSQLLDACAMVRREADSTTVLAVLRRCVPRTRFPDVAASDSASHMNDCRSSRGCVAAKSRTTPGRRPSAMGAAA